MEKFLYSKTMGSCLEILKRYKKNLKDYIHPDASAEEVCVEAIKVYPQAFGLIDKMCQTEKMCLEAVKRAPYNLRYVRPDLLTKKIKLEAVKGDWRILQFIQDQTPEMAAEAIKADESAYRYIRLPKNPDRRIQFIEKLKMLLDGNLDISKLPMRTGTVQWQE